MQSNRRQLASLLRIAVVLSAFTALVAMTSGLLLAIHLNSFEHPADHDAQDCSFCRHLLVPSKKFLPGPCVEFVRATCTPHGVPTAPVRHIPAHHPRASQPRAPPAAMPYPWA